MKRVTCHKCLVCTSHALGVLRFWRGSVVVGTVPSTIRLSGKDLLGEIVQVAAL